MATVARGHVAGGFTVPAAAWLATTKCTASAASASTTRASAKRVLDSEVEGEEDEENEEEDDESTGRGRGAPPSYGELSSHFGILERAAQDSGNADAALYLSKARMAMIAAYANKRTRQADLREFVSTE